MEGIGRTRYIISFEDRYSTAHDGIIFHVAHGNHIINLLNT